LTLESTYPAGLPKPIGQVFLFWLAHVAQSVERILGKDEVTSSILVVGSKRKEEIIIPNPKKEEIDHVEAEV
jgi:hypothetical protein